MPSKNWIRSSLLFWDEIATIVPRYCWEDQSYLEYDEDNELKFLLEEGLYRPIFPDIVNENKNPDRYKEFENIYFKHLESFLGSSDHIDSIICPSMWSSGRKINYRGIECIREMGYISTLLLHGLYDIGNDLPFKQQQSFKTFFSLLAEYVAYYDDENTTPLTDIEECRDSIYLSHNRISNIPCAEIFYQNVIPTPKDDVELRKIIDFKEDYEIELRKYYNYIQNFSFELSSIKNDRELLHIVDNYNSQIQIGVKDLTEELKDYNIQTINGSIRTLFEPQSPELITALGLFAGISTNSPLLFTLGAVGLTTSGILKISSYLVDRSIERRELLRKSPFAYLYYVNKKFE